MKTFTPLLRAAFAASILVSSCGTNEHGPETVTSEEVCRLVFDCENCSKEQMRNFNETLNSAGYNAYYYYSRTQKNKTQPLSYLDFLKDLKLTEFGLLCLDEWIWVSETNDFGTTNASDTDVRDTRRFIESNMYRKLNSENWDKSSFTLEGATLKSIDDSGYEMTEEIIRLTEDSLVLYIPKFNNQKTYISRGVMFGSRSRYLSATNPSNDDISTYRSFATSALIGESSPELVDLNLLTNGNGVSMSTSNGRMHLNSEVYNGYFYKLTLSPGPTFGPDNYAYDEGISSNWITIGHVKNGWNDGLQITFSYNKFKNVTTSLVNSTFYLDGYKTGRSNWYAENSSEPYIVHTAFFNSFNVYTGCDGKYCNDRKWESSLREW